MSWTESLLPPDNTLPWEYAVEASDAKRYPFAWSVIRTLQNPFAIPADLLPLLAWAFSVDIWHAGWAIEKMRSVTASAARDHELIGTIAGIRRYLAIEDAELVQYLAPPQRFFASPGLTKEQQDGWLAALPQLRLYFRSRPGTAGAWAFTDWSFADDGFADLDQAPAHYGRFPVLVKDGVQTPLRGSTIIDTVQAVETSRVDQVHIPGKGGDTFADAGVADVMFTDLDAVPARIYTIRLDLTYDHVTSELALTQALPGLDPIDTRFEQASEIGHVGSSLFADFGCADQRFAADDDGPFMVYQMVRLNDPAVMAPIVNCFAFADVTRLDMPSFTVELLVDATGRVPIGFGFEGGYADSLFAADEDLSRLRDVLAAVDVSKGVENRALVSTELMRERTWGDGLPLDGKTPLVSFVANRL